MSRLNQRRTTSSLLYGNTYFQLVSYLPVLRRECRLFILSTFLINTLKDGVCSKSLVQNVLLNVSILGKGWHPNSKLCPTGSSNSKIGGRLSETGKLSARFPPIGEGWKRSECMSRQSQINKYSSFVRWVFRERFNILRAKNLETLRVVPWRDIVVTNLDFGQPA